MSDRKEPSATAYAELRNELREVELLASTAGLLSWDQETMLPPKGTPLRAEQLAMLSQLAHERRTSPRFGDLLAEAESDDSLKDDPLARANLREMRREYDHAVKLPTSLVRALAETTTHSQHAWRDARQTSDFYAFAPWLEKVVALVRAKAECLAGSDTADLYDPLLDSYEPGARTADIVAVFGDLRDRLTPLIQEIAEADRRPADTVLGVNIPIARQTAFNAMVAQRVGFDFGAGRLDTSTHPFCQGVGPGDTRLTTRYREDAFFDALSSTLHETGHGLYEQGLPKERYLGEPLSDAVSLGIHESQSRMWENFVGRSREFWQWALPEARRTLGEPLEPFDLDEVYGAMNLVKPGLIRVDSDEATYNLHIMLRFDLERAMLSGDLPVADLPGAWNQRIRADLGLEVPDDRRGCLQDVHWSMGAIGYFPTYTLGNLYAAQLWRRIVADLPDLDESFTRGEFGELLGWLRREIHQHGRRYTAPILCEQVTGEPLSAMPFMSYLDEKLRPLYGI
ncbi:MAG: carboxypeptidase M32 [Gemmatimonadota bacterium]